MTRLDEIRAKLRSVDTESMGTDDLEYASDLDFLLARVEKLEEALKPFADKAEVFKNRSSLVGPSPLYALHDEILEAARVLGG